MIKVLMNETTIERMFGSKEEAKKYVSSCKKIDKKYNAKNKYKIVEAA